MGCEGGDVNNQKPEWDVRLARRAPRPDEDYDLDIYYVYETDVYAAVRHVAEEMQSGQHCISDYVFLARPHGGEHSEWEQYRAYGRRVVEWTIVREETGELPKETKCQE